MPPTDWIARGRRAWCLGLAAVGCLVLLGPGLPAAAAGDNIGPQGWVRTGALGPVQPQQGRTYVSMLAGQEQARAFVTLAVDGLAPEPLANATLVLATDPSSTAADRALVSVCGLKAALTSSGEVQGRPPDVDCQEPLLAEPEPDGGWRISLAAFADRLSTGALAGVALVPVAGGPTAAAFTVAFDAEQTALELPTTAGTTPPGGPTAVPHDSPRSSLSAEAPSGAAATGGAPFAPPPSLNEEDGTAQSGPGALAAPPPIVAEQDQDLVAAAAGHSNTVSLVLVALVALVAGLLVLAWNRRGAGVNAGLASAGIAPVAAARLAPWVLVPALVMLLPESSAFKVGIIAIVFVAAIGLHLLVNVAGELSLAHAAFLGIPAFVVAQLCAKTGLSPLLGVPVGVLTGAALGLVVAVTAFRARGLQVALVTLAVAIATVQFLFFREWLVGPLGGFEVEVPSLFGVQLDTSVSRVPVLAALVLLATVAGTAILRSKIGRGLSLLRSSPEVAAAAGVPVGLYRGMAYAIAGGFAGLAGACYVFWVQLVTPQAFPLQLGFTYLLIAALAGRGGLGGVAVSAVFVQGGALFTFLPRSLALFLAPVVLILQITRFEGGINAALRSLRTLVLQRASMFMPRPVPAETSATRPAGPAVIRLSAAVGYVLIAAGFTAMALAWYNTGRTDQLWIQNQEIASGGFIGIGLVILGSALLLRDALLHGRTMPSVRPGPEVDSLLALTAAAPLVPRPLGWAQSADDTSADEQQNSGDSGRRARPEPVLAAHATAAPARAPRTRARAARPQP